MSRANPIHYSKKDDAAVKMGSFTYKLLYVDTNVFKWVFFLREKSFRDVANQQRETYIFHTCEKRYVQ